MSLAGALEELRDELETRLQDRWGGALASLVARTSDVLARYKAHIGNIGGAWHAVADTANGFLAIAPVTREQCYAVLALVAAGLAAHLLTGGAVHAIADNVNAVSAPPATDSDSGVALANNLAAVLDAHRTEPGVHALSDTANAITSDSAITGTLGTADGLVHAVEVGDRHLDNHYTGGPCVVLAWNGATPNGPRDVGTTPRVISQRDHLIEAHCWIATTEPATDFRANDIARIGETEGLLDELERAVYRLQHGAKGVRTQPFTEMAVTRDVALMKFGEECIALFEIPIPVTEGPTYLPALGTASAGTGGLVVNPA